MQMYKSNIRWQVVASVLLVIFTIGESFTPLNNGIDSRSGCRLQWRNAGEHIPTTPISTTLLYLIEDDESVQVLFGSSDFDSVESLEKASEKSQDIFSSLEARQKELNLGIGKRFVTRTQNGFLNVHYEPTDPYDNTNVVNQLEEGQIVTSTGPARGLWIPHDGGGWSIAKFGGFTWLEPINE